MQCNVIVVLIAIGMSVVGTLLLEVVGFGKAEMAGEWGRLKYYAYIAAVSSAVWFAAYHLWIKRGARSIDTVMLVIGIPFVISWTRCAPMSPDWRMQA